MTVPKKIVPEDDAGRRIESPTRADIADVVADVKQREDSFASLFFDDRFVQAAGDAGSGFFAGLTRGDDAMPSRINDRLFTADESVDLLERTVHGDLSWASGVAWERIEEIYNYRLTAFVSLILVVVVFGLFGYLSVSYTPGDGPSLR